MNAKQKNHEQRNRIKLASLNNDEGIPLKMYFSPPILLSSTLISMTLKFKNGMHYSIGYASPLALHHNSLPSGVMVKLPPDFGFKSCLFKVKLAEIFSIANYGFASKDWSKMWLSR